MGKAENKVETFLKEGIEALGGLTYKQDGPGRRGKPDQLAILPYGIVWFVECKRPEGGLSSGQIREIQRLENLGHLVDVVASRQEVTILLNKMKHTIEIQKQILEGKKHKTWVGYPSV